MDEKKIFDEYGNYNFPTEKKQEGLNTIEDIKCLLVCKKWGEYFVECDENPNCIDCIAKEIRNAGYRKESDTAREIFEKIFEVLCCFTTQGKSEDYNEGYIDCIAEVDKRLQNLAKEKYGADLGE